MQNTTTQPKPSNLLSGLGLVAIGAVATALFLLTVNSFGLINLGTRGASLPPSDLTITTKDFRFGQEEVRVKVGQTITLELDNADILPHSFDVDEFDLHIPMPGKERVTATFTPTQPGIYSFYCGVPGHVEAGMVGSLIVEP